MRVNIVLDDPSWPKMVGICDLLGTTYTPVSKIPSVKRKCPGHTWTYWTRILDSNLELVCMFLSNSCRNSSLSNPKWVKTLWPSQNIWTLLQIIRYTKSKYVILSCRCWWGCPWQRRVTPNQMAGVRGRGWAGLNWECPGHTRASWRLGLEFFTFVVFLSFRDA